jgi:hypothetical protein
MRRNSGAQRYSPIGRRDTKQEGTAGSGRLRYEGTPIKLRDKQLFHCSARVSKERTSRSL